ncbi:alpha/beta fold hydrolase [Dactylosporangium sp. CS-033363]|uniref:alpha/beta fold hydrolase n=1 Tax=Dactylosporangium sp. CS-033363 TaxID=3239935 RepID=UPI003D8B5AA0
MSGVRAHVLRDGSPLVVLAHGLEDSWQSWHAFARGLDPDWGVVALDLPWRTGNDYRWRTRPAGQWLADGLAQVGRVPDMLVAHSFGGSAALQLCAGTAGDIAGTVTVICPIYRTAQQPVTWKAFELSRLTYTHHMRDGVRARLGPRAREMEAGVLDTMMDLALERAGPSGFFTVFDQYLTSPQLPLGDVTEPVLVIAGDEDPTLTHEAALALAAAIPHGAVRAHEDYDHFCHIRHAAAVAAQVADFHASLRTVRQRP